MTQFGDDLRALLAKKKDQLSARDAIAERARAADARRRDDLEAAAEGIARDVFAPLLGEFAAALVAAGVFRTSSEVTVGRHARGAHTCHVSGFAPGAIVRVRFYAAATAEGRIALAGECQLKEKEEVRRMKAKNRVEEVWTTLFDEPDSGDDSSFIRHPSSLVKIAGKSVAPEHAKNPSVELWCREALKSIAEACLEANRR